MKLLLACTIVTVIFLASAATAQIIPGDPGTYPSVSIVDTPHNLNNYPGITIEGDQVCIPCHTPHNSPPTGENNLLWNHAETQEIFIMYSDAAGQPEGVSKKCLGCHDGVTAIDAYGGNPGPVVMTGPKALGTDLSNDHPIGIEYPMDQPFGFHDPADFDPGINGGPGVQLININGVDRVECTSCHHVHDNGLGKFLRVPVLESYICLQCHIK